MYLFLILFCYYFIFCYYIHLYKFVYIISLDLVCFSGMQKKGVGAFFSFLIIIASNAT